MKINKLLITLSLTLTSPLTLTGCAESYYTKVGAGYKIDETNIQWYDSSPTSPISARIEVGAKKGNFLYGINHRSQYLSGKPFNNNSEYQVTEVFVDYVWEF